MLKTNQSIWIFTTIIWCFTLLLPIGFLLSFWLQPQQPDIWQHIVDHLLGRLLTNTVILVIGVGTLATFIGGFCAYCVTRFEFPGRKLFEWALVLPLAIPTYVLAFVFLGIFDFAGPVQTTMRSVGINFAIPVRSTIGLIVVLSLGLFPYIYLMTRAALCRQTQMMIDAAKTLGATPLDTFKRVTLPLTLPAMLSGLALVLMETLAEFGAVSVFNFDTFTTAIYKSWFDLFSLSTAAQLSTILLGFVGLLMVAKGDFHKQSVAELDSDFCCPRRQSLPILWQWFISIMLGLILALGFLFPLIQLVVWVIGNNFMDFNQRYWLYSLHTLQLAAMTMGILIIMSLCAAYAQRLSTNKLLHANIKGVNLGYAIPGSVLAVAILLCFTFLDKYLLIPFTKTMNGNSALVLTGSLVGLVLAYCLRFFAMSYRPIQDGFSRIQPVLVDAATNLGASKSRVLINIIVPLLRPGILTAGLLVMVEVMKEMPATLILRPIGWETFAARIYELTSEGDWERAALPALTLVIIGLIPVRFLIKKSQ